MFILPFENASQKFFTTEIVARLVFSPPQILLDCGLGSDSGVIHPRQPENLKALHSRAAAKNVLNCVVEHVPKREHPRDVWRRHHDCERRLRRFLIRNEIVIVDPALIPFRFN